MRRLKGNNDVVAGTISHWVKINRVMLVNAGSLVGTTTITSGLGFVYWWLAARQFTPAAVGFASAAISAMTLLGTGCVMGLGTLLIGELPRQPGREASLIGTAIMLVGALGVAAGLLFAALAPVISPHFAPLRTSVQAAALFTAGASLTAITIMLDQAVIGLLRGELQLWRNILSSVIKLVVLLAFGLWLWQWRGAGMAIYATWAIGSASSLAALAAYAIVKARWPGNPFALEWRWVRKLGPTALQHHTLNLVIRVPALLLPVLVTILLSATMNAWFYVAFMMANFVFSIPVALTTVLYAINAARSDELAHKARQSMALSLAISAAGGCILFFGARQVLGIFGHSYAEEAAWSLRILALGALPVIIKNHYIAVYRVHDRIARAILPVTLGCLLELSAADVGAHIGNLVGLSLGWVLALYLEMAFMMPVVFTIIWPSTLANRAGGTERRRIMNLLRYSPSISSIDTRVRGFGQRAARAVRAIKPMDILGVALPLGAFLLWLISLPSIDLTRMNDLGLISVFTPATIAALMLMVASFGLSLRQPRWPILLLHLLLLIFMLYGVTTLIEQAPRFSVLYRHAGYTEYIMRTGTVDPELDAYFNWPGFFILAAFVTRISGFASILAYAVWAPVALNLLYMIPMYVIFTSFSAEKRTVWLALWLFALTNWIGQDYFSPQGFDFFLYLVIIAILLRWFTFMPPERALIAWNGPVKRGQYLLRYPARSIRAWLREQDTLAARAPIAAGQRAALLVLILVIFAFIVCSHPLTPFFTMVSVGALVIFRRCSPWWLPVAMALMTGIWIIMMTQPFLVGHLNWVTGGLGAITRAFSANVSSRLSGSPQHNLIVKIGLLMTVIVWGLAAAGALHRLLRGYHDLSLMLLAITPFPLLIAEPYGGEMLLRIYLFALPPMAFFAASLFYPRPITVPRASKYKTAALAITTILLLVGFMFTRYGNERMDYMTYNEVNGMRYLYSIAPPHSTFIESWDGSPWQFQDFELYNTYSLTDTIPNAVIDTNTRAVIQFIRSKSRSAAPAYIFFTRSQRATAELASGLSRGTLDRLETALLESGSFLLVYTNSDVQILQYAGP